MLHTLYVVHFSPTGGTKRAALCLGQVLATQVREIDLSLPAPEKQAFGANDIVLFAMPVFGGRIPTYILEKIQACQGSSTVAIAVAVYGNRAYDDALLELSDALKTQGFRVPVCAALVAEHSIVRTVAAGRPDAQDQADCRMFAAKILAKLHGEAPNAEPQVPGNRPYHQWTPSPLVPAASEACTRCGLCAVKCPTGAIPREAPETTLPPLCMRCMRCVSICPQRARALPPQAQALSEAKLAPCIDIRRANELFL